MNLLHETIEILEDRNKINEVLYVTNGDAYMTWEEFKKEANFTYDAGYGGVVIDQDLKVVGSDWWLERREYDGSEWWSFQKLPTKRRTHRVFNPREDR